MLDVADSKAILLFEKLNHQSIHSWKKFVSAIMAELRHMNWNLINEQNHIIIILNWKRLEVCVCVRFY